MDPYALSDIRIRCLLLLEVDIHLRVRNADASFVKGLLARLLESEIHVPVGGGFGPGPDDEDNGGIGHGFDLDLDCRLLEDVLIPGKDLMDDLEGLVQISIIGDTDLHVHPADRVPAEVNDVTCCLNNINI